MTGRALRIGRRLAGLGVGAIAAVAALCGTAMAQDARPAFTIPAEVQRTALAPALTAWTTLPPLRVDAAQLSVGGIAYRWQILDRAGAFSLVLSETADGNREWAGYVGVQRLSVVTERRGARVVQRPLRIGPVTPTAVAAGVLAISGIEPAAIAVAFPLEAEVDGVLRRFEIARKVVGADVAKVTVNGVPYSLAAFVVELQIDRPGWGDRLASQSSYVPVLGMGVNGRNLEPVPFNWEVQSVTVAASVEAEVKAAALR